MPPRATWKGQLRISLVSFPVRLYNATTSTGRVTLNQLNRNTGQRLRQQMIDPETGPVERPDIVKGYEFEKGRYVTIEESDLESIKLETTRIIEVVQFAPSGEVDPLYLNSPYYLAPDGAVAEDAFGVIRTALEKTDTVAIGRVVMSNREQIVAIRPEAPGLVLTTLRYVHEVRKPDAYFDDIKESRPDKKQLELATQLIKGMSAPFDASQFEDRYQQALMDLIKSKIDGSEPVVAKEAEVGKVINLMDALKQSIEGASQRKPPAKSVTRKKAKKSTRKTKKAKRA